MLQRRSLDLFKLCISRAVMTDAAQKLVSLSDVTEDELLDRAKQHLQRGGVVAVPTDTIYGVAALAQNTKGIRQLYTIKERDRQKPIAICVGDVEDIEKWAEFDKSMLPLLSKLLPGPVTVLLRRRTALNPELNPTRESVGVRVPGDRLVRRLAQCCGEPLALTSANVSGERSTLAPKEFEHLWPLLDLVIDGGVIQAGVQATARSGSTIVNLVEHGRYRVDREGCALEDTKRKLEEHGWTEAT